MSEIEVSLTQGHEIPEPDEINAPYDPNGHEAWDLTSHILRHRLGEYSVFGRSAPYLAAPAGSRTAGFQEEFPVEFMKSSSGDNLALNLMAKGVIFPGTIPIWMHTKLGLSLRNMSTGSVMMTDPELAIVREPTSLRYEPDIFTAHGNRIKPNYAEKVVRYLRLAKKFLYLPEYVESRRANSD